MYGRVWYGCLFVGSDIYPHLPEPLSIESDAPIPIDVSKATRLRSLSFRHGPLSCRCEWVTAALKTITSEHRDFQEISIQVPYPTLPYREAIIGGGAAPGAGWSDLDHLLIQFWESGSVSLEVVYPRWGEMSADKDWVADVLPEASKRAKIRFR